MSGGWVCMSHPDTGGAARFADFPGVVAAQEARGWVVADEQPDPDALDVPEPVPAEPVAKPKKKAVASAETEGVTSG